MNSILRVTESKFQRKKWILGLFLATYVSQLSVLRRAAGRSRQGRGSHSRCIAYGGAWLPPSSALLHVHTALALCKQRHCGVEDKSTFVSRGSFTAPSSTKSKEALTLHNLHRSDLSRMERTRITQSRSAITWSRHATHSWFQYRCQQRKNTQGRKQVPVAQSVRERRVLDRKAEAWQTLSLRSHRYHWRFGDYAGPTSTWGPQTDIWPMM